MLSDMGFAFWVTLCVVRSCTWWSLWVPSDSGCSMEYIFQGKVGEQSFVLKLYRCMLTGLPLQRGDILVLQTYWYYRAEWIVQVSQSQLWRQAEILLFRSLRWRACMYPSSCYEQTEMSRCFSYSTCRELNHKAGSVEAYSQKVSWLIEYLSLARVVSTVLIAFDVSCGEEFLLYFTLLPIKA